MLNEMVLCEELFHTPSGVAFADFITEGHRETWPIRSKRFRTWLRRCYYHATGSAPSAAKSFLNLSNQNDFVLVVAWLLAALRSSGPYPLLAISGEQGSTKTVLSKLLRALVDPHVAPVRALPREERELMIAANNGHLLAFDNLSGLPAWLSDALCRLASGGSFAVRQLYTDDSRRRPAGRYGSTISSDLEAIVSS